LAIGSHESDKHVIHLMTTKDTKGDEGIKIFVSLVSFVVIYLISF
jgi:hypothetical protein